MKIIDYEILSEKTIAILASHVRGDIKDGWQPYGDIVVVIDEVQRFIYFYQAMVKYEKGNA